MGQRLVVDIKNRKGDVLANAYYHWSGYTDSSLDTTKKIVDAASDKNFIDGISVLNGGKYDEVLYAIKLLEETGAGLKYNEDEENDTISDLVVAKKKFPGVGLKKCVDRNEGITCITEEEMDDSRSWEEAHVDINIDTKMVNFCVVFEADREYLTYEAGVDSCDMSDDEIDAAISKYVDGLKDIGSGVDIDIESIPFDRFAEYFEIIENAGYTFKYHGTVYYKIA